MHNNSQASKPIFNGQPKPKSFANYQFDRSEKGTSDQESRVSKTYKKDIAHIDSTSQNDQVDGSDRKVVVRSVNGSAS